MTAVLVVDDNADFLGVTRQLLVDARPGTTVHTVQSGAEALAFLTHDTPYEDAPCPGFVVLDFRLPDMPAPMLLIRVRSDPAMTSLPILVLSQAGWPEDARAALAAGASAFVVKPSRAHALRSVLLDFWRAHVD